MISLSIMLSRTCTGAWSVTVTAAIWGSKNAQESCSMAVVLVQNGVHSWPKSHFMHDEVGSDVSSGPCLDTMILFLQKRSNPADEANGPWRNKFSMFATTRCRGLSLSR